MPKELFFMRVSDGLVPVDEDTSDYLAKIERGEHVVLKASSVRNVGNHRRYFKFIALTFDIQDHFDDREIWRKYVQIMAGHCDFVTSPKNGQIMPIPKSIAWADLDEEDFKQLFNRAVNAFLDRFGKGLTKDDFMKALEFA